MRLYSILEKDGIKKTYNILNEILDTTIHLMDLNKTVDTIKLMKKQKMTPKIKYLQVLGNMDNLPEEIYA